jgi:hypothetical protein
MKDYYFTKLKSGVFEVSIMANYIKDLIRKNKNGINISNFCSQFKGMNCIQFVPLNVEPTRSAKTTRE